MISSFQTLRELAQHHIPEEISTYAFCVATFAYKPHIIYEGLSKDSISIQWGTAEQPITVTFYYKALPFTGSIIVGEQKMVGTPSTIYYTAFKVLRDAGMDMNEIYLHCEPSIPEQQTLDRLYITCKDLAPLFLSGQISSDTFYQGMFLDSFITAITNISVLPDHTLILQFSPNMGVVYDIELSDGPFPTITLICMNGIKKTTFKCNRLVDAISCLAQDKVPLAVIWSLYPAKPKAPNPTGSINSTGETSFFTNEKKPEPVAMGGDTGKTYLVRITETYTKDVEITAETQQELGMKALEYTKGHPESLSNGFIKTKSTIKRLS